MKKLINLNLTGVTRGIPLMKQYRNLFIILTVALFLTACGGGGGTTLSTSTAGGSGGGSTTNPNPPVVQKDIATLVMEVETAVEAFDTAPTQAQVDAAITAIMAADAAIAAAGAGVDTSMHTTRLNELRPTVTVTAAELAVGAIDATTPTQAQVDKANTAIMAAKAAITAAMNDAEADVDTSMYTPRLTAVTVRAAELAVMAIHDTEPTPEQVNAANMAITAANAAIAALDAGTAKTTYMGQIDALEPTVTVAGQRVSILTAIKAAEMAVEALGDPPYDEVTQAQIDAAQMAINKIPQVLDPVQTPDVDQMEKTNEYTPTFTKLNATLIEVRQFVDADLATAATAKTAAGTGETDVTTFATGSTDITAIEDGQTISVAMGVSENIGTGEDITTLNNLIAEIEKQRLLAVRAKKNLEAEAAALGTEKMELETQLKDILGLEAEEEYTDQHIDSFRTAVTKLEDDASEIENHFADFEDDVMDIEDEITNLETEITNLETEITNLEGQPDDGTLAMKMTELNEKKSQLETKEMELDAIITTGDTTRSLQLPGDTKAIDYTYTVLKKKATDARTSATEKKAELVKIDNELVPEIQMKEDAVDAKEGEADDADGHIMAIEGILNPLKTRFGVLRDVAALQSEKAGLVFDLLREPLQDPDYENRDRVTQNAVRNSPLKAVTDVLADLDTMDHVFVRADKEDEWMTFEEITANRNIAANLDPNDDDLWNSTTKTVTGILGGRSHFAINMDGRGTADFVAADGVLSSLSGTQVEHGTFKGFEGTLYCDGTCSISSNSFSTDWYFTPAVDSDREATLGYNPAEARFEDSGDDGTYEAVSYVDYGMWLEGADDALMLERRIGVRGPNQDPSNLDLGTDGSNTDTNATYRGDAHGLSARTIGIRDDAVTASGHFIADVELNVEFRATAELVGTIDNFRAVEGQGSDHVDDDWSLELRGAADGNNEFDGRYFRGGTGHWTATPYGATSGERPDGFYGGFNAVFSDNDGGAAAGVYSTEKVESE